MTKLLSALLAILIFSACDSDKKITGLSKTDSSENRKTGTPSNFPAIDSSLHLGMFLSIPDTIDGCGEFFVQDTSYGSAGPYISLSNQDTSYVSEGPYIFLSNMNEFAIMMINGERVFMDRDTSESRVMSDKSYKAVYKNSTYKAILKVTMTKSYDEGGFYSGTLEIIGDRIKMLIKVHGQTGC